MKVLLLALFTSSAAFAESAMDRPITAALDQPKPARKWDASKLVTGLPLHGSADR